jgi:hypothetical protein
MKVLHILRSEPDALTRKLIAGMANGGQGKEIALYRGGVDYARLVDDIFASDKVICWWAGRGDARANPR